MEHPRRFNPNHPNPRTPERQFGTLEWQVLLPMATGQQWVIKVATAFVPALLLGVGCRCSQAAWIGACAIIGMTLIAALELASRVAWLSREY